MMSMQPSSQHAPSAAEHDDLLARYTLHSRADILFQLRAIQKRKLLVNLDLQPAGRSLSLRCWQSTRPTTR